MRTTVLLVVAAVVEVPRLGLEARVRFRYSRRDDDDDCGSGFSVVRVWRRVWNDGRRRSRRIWIVEYAECE